ncbi:MAG: type II secretion system major pseudopilin GspG [Phycisphaerae bacterium]|jgi:general secretion pathway protein G
MPHDPESMIQNPRSRSAFTLIEFIVVMIIIGILAALIVPRFMGRIGGAKQSVALANIRMLEGKVLEFQADCGRYPSAHEGLRALLQPPSDVSAKWKGPYVQARDIIDPWEREFIYRRPGQRSSDFDLFTLGADGQEGGEDEDKDIGNW